MSAWIEIKMFGGCTTYKTVALYMSAWIEIRKGNSPLFEGTCRTLHECVD